MNHIRSVTLNTILAIIAAIIFALAALGVMVAGVPTIQQIAAGLFLLVLALVV